VRTDPRAACANADERLLWALVHDGIAHPLMAITCYSRMSVWFHDWTSNRAWPRSPDLPRLRRAMTATHPEFGRMSVRECAPVGVYSIKHGRRDLVVRVQARDLDDALIKGVKQFKLQAEHEAAR
jgi:hypothetical protein